MRAIDLLLAALKGWQKVDLLAAIDAADRVRPLRVAAVESFCCEARVGTPRRRPAGRLRRPAARSTSAGGWPQEHCVLSEGLPRNSVALVGARTRAWLNFSRVAASR